MSFTTDNRRSVRWTSRVEEKENGRLLSAWEDKLEARDLCILIVYRVRREIYAHIGTCEWLVWDVAMGRARRPESLCNQIVDDVPLVVRPSVRSSCPLWCHNSFNPSATTDSMAYGPLILHRASASVAPHRHRRCLILDVHQPYNYWYCSHVVSGVQLHHNHSPGLVHIAPAVQWIINDRQQIGWLFMDIQNGDARGILLVTIKGLS